MCSFTAFWRGCFFVFVTVTVISFFFFLSGWFLFFKGVMSWGGKSNYSFSQGSYPRVHLTWFECVADSEELSWKIAKVRRES